MLCNSRSDGTSLSSKTWYLTKSTRSDEVALILDKLYIQAGLVSPSLKQTISTANYYTAIVSGAPALTCSNKLLLSTLEHLVRSQIQTIVQIWHLNLTTTTTTAILAGVLTAILAVFLTAVLAAVLQIWTPTGWLTCAGLWPQIQDGQIPNQTPSCRSGLSLHHLEFQLRRGSGRTRLLTTRQPLLSRQLVNPTRRRDLSPAITSRTIIA